MTAATASGPGARGEPPDDDHVHECGVEGCLAWRYSWLALQFHQLHEHVLPGEGDR